MFGCAARKLMLLSTLIAPLATGCAATVYEEDVVYVRHRHNHVVFHDAPNLVYIGDGVYVVQDYGTAVYYVDGSYYYHDDGIWYSSSYWSSPWSVAHIGFVPVHIHHRHHAHYVHYHGGHGSHVVKAPSHEQDHTAAKPSHGGHEAAGPTTSEPSEPHTKSAKYDGSSLNTKSHAKDLSASSEPAARDGGNRFTSTTETRSEPKSASRMVEADKSRAEPVSSRAASGGTASRPSDEDDSARRSAAKTPSKSSKSPAITKASANKTKKSKPTKKKSRR